MKKFLRAFTEGVWELGVACITAIVMLYIVIGAFNYFFPNGLDGVP